MHLSHSIKNSDNFLTLKYKDLTNLHRICCQVTLKFRLNYSRWLGKTFCNQKIVSIEFVTFKKLGHMPHHEDPKTKVLVIKNALGKSESLEFYP